MHDRRATCKMRPNFAAGMLRALIHASPMRRLMSRTEIETEQRNKQRSKQMDSLSMQRVDGQVQVELSCRLGTVVLPWPLLRPL